MPAKQAKVTIHLTQEDADWLVEHLKKRVGWDNDPTWVETRILNELLGEESD